MLDTTRRARIEGLVGNAHKLLDAAIELQHADKRRVVAIVAAFSGGDDSTTLAHMFRDRITHVVHANTGIGIEATREYVRDTCATWRVPLIERHPEPGAGYRDLVLGRVRIKTGPKAGQRAWAGGFPGPAAHWLMYQRLKERPIEQMQRELIGNPWRERIIVLAGRRAEESQRRTARLGGANPIERRRSKVWVSPLLGWSKLDLNTYRMLNPDLGRNPVSALLHMSGECLCGAFAKRGEIDEIGEWFPNVRRDIEQLERDVTDAGIVAPERCRWGWGADRERASKSGPMCSSCDARFDGKAS